MILMNFLFKFSGMYHNKVFVRNHNISCMARVCIVPFYMFTFTFTSNIEDKGRNMSIAALFHIFYFFEKWEIKGASLLMNKM